MCTIGNTGFSSIKEGEGERREGYYLYPLVTGMDGWRGGSWMELATVFIHGITGMDGWRGREVDGVGYCLYPWDTGMDGWRGREGDGVGYCLYPWDTGMDGRS